MYFKTHYWYFAAPCINTNCDSLLSPIAWALLFRFMHLSFSLRLLKERPYRKKETCVCSLGRAQYDGNLMIVPRTNCGTHRCNNQTCKVERWRSSALSPSRQAASIKSRLDFIQIDLSHLLSLVEAGVEDADGASRWTRLTRRVWIMRVVGCFNCRDFQSRVQTEHVQSTEVLAKV